MPLSHPRATRLIALTTVFLCGSSLAHALEGKALLDKYISLAESRGTTFQFGSVEEQSSDSFTLSDITITNKKGQTVTVGSLSFGKFRETDEGHITYDKIELANLRGETLEKKPFGIASVLAAAGDVPVSILEGGLTAEEKKKRIKFGELTFSGFAVDAEKTKVTTDKFSIINADIPLDFRYDQKQTYEGAIAAPMTFDNLSIAGVSGSAQGVDWQIGSMSIDDASVPTSTQADILEWLKVYSRMSIDNVKFAIGGADIFAMGTLNGTIDKPDGDGTINTKSAMEGLWVNLKAIPDPQTQAIAQQLGYQTVEGSMTGDGSYNIGTGRMSVSNMVLKLKDMFDIGFDYALTGYTQDVAQKLNDVQLKIAQGTPPAGAFAGVLPELKNVKLENLKVGVTDHSLTGRLLDFQAKQMGTTGDQLARGAPVMLGLGMARLQMPEFSEMVTQAVGKFLETRGTLTVEAVPPQPVSIIDVVVAGQSDPTKVPGILNLKVNAQ